MCDAPWLSRRLRTLESWFAGGPGSPVVAASGPEVVGSARRSPCVEVKPIETRGGEVEVGPIERGGDRSRARLGQAGRPRGKEVRGRSGGEEGTVSGEATSPGEAAPRGVEERGVGRPLVDADVAQAATGSARTSGPEDPRAPRGDVDVGWRSSSSPVGGARHPGSRRTPNGRPGPGERLVGARRQMTRASGPRHRAVRLRESARRGW